MVQIGQETLIKIKKIIIKIEDIQINKYKRTI